MKKKSVKQETKKSQNESKKEILMKEILKEIQAVEKDVDMNVTRLEIIKLEHDIEVLKAAFDFVFCMLDTAFTAAFDKSAIKFARENIARARKALDINNKPKEKKL